MTDSACALKIESMKHVIVVLAMLLVSPSSFAALCGVDATGEFFLNAKKEEIALSFSLPTLKGAVDPENAQVFLDENFRAPRAYKKAFDLLEARLKEKKLVWALTDRAVSPDLDPKDLQKKLKKAKVKKADIDTILLLGLGPVAYFQFKHPELKLTVVSLPESEELQTFLLQLEAKSTELLKETPGSGMKSSEAERLIEINQSDLFSGAKEKSAEYQALIAKIKKAPMKKLVTDFRSWIESGIDMMTAREKQLTESILLQSGPGAVIAAKGHGAGVTERLSNDCPKFRKSP